MLIPTRRHLLATAGALLLVPQSAFAASSMVVHKDPSCDCCGAWVDHVRLNGFEAKVVEVTAINRIKARLGVPRDLMSCHTAEIGGYVIEGHVPAAEIKRLLQQGPKATGLAVAGMPTGSPGMEAPGAQPDAYDVILFGPGKVQTVFARYRGGTQL